MDTLNDKNINNRGYNNSSNDGIFGSGSSYGSGGFNMSGGDRGFDVSRGGTGKTLGFAIASIALGASALLFLFFSLINGLMVFVSLPCAIVGLVFGISSYRKSYGGIVRGFSLGGLISSAVAVGLGAIWSVVVIISMMSFFSWYGRFF